ncbi:sugar 3,4-ketoisomerase [Francisella philomiragia]|uniref:sugar 3,4-ketoisomerase n=1 Tax=Francisella philomiragia TaxID=28110 RepID=UPI0019064840|nr:FdtA/QdtA family cupin domain-containing protein [Francisella philomiragia]MBK2267750.1 WxcM-like domain-containing protein [Francisella philomiragia]MBK2279152.1 WxcM-like domain-containing protein [Francisella philomiragia]MBK2287059.1 WxcM-like domain-containing protein [Francisella philomiragia]MBK2288984.1 WxcM-like domain-containing protein [Francisella philomiragia]MBK2290702.1 WxcM-like domain-containing protein [Francisella philomiragia]
MQQLLEFKVFGDDRGSLVSLEQNKNIPFDIKRVYYIYGTKEIVRRGFHAHKNLSQVLICVSGSCKILVDDGKTKKDVLLESPEKGLLITGLIWREMFDFSPDCVLMVLASDYYDESDYIKSYDDFMEMVKNVK